MQPVREAYGSTTEKTIAALDKAWREKKLTWVKTPYWRKDENGKAWFGRGDVQLTHEANYEGAMRDAVKAAFGVDIHADPDLVLRPDISAFILVEGITKGETNKSDFTKWPLENFINESKTDYVNARKTVNPGETDSYELIAGYARKFESAIRLARAAAGEPFKGERSKSAVDLYDGKYHVEVASVQTKLDALGYPEVGSIDGKWGGRTAGTILTFRNDNGLPKEGRIDDALLAALMKAEPRKIAPERLNATVKDLREVGAKDIKAADNNEIAGVVAAGGGLLAGAGKLVDAGEQYSDLFKRVDDLIQPLQNILIDNIWLILLGVGGVVIWLSGVLKSIRLAKHRLGEDVSQ
jgi:hypothetical protein